MLSCTGRYSAPWTLSSDTVCPTGTFSTVRSHQISCFRCGPRMSAPVIAHRSRAYTCAALQFTRAVVSWEHPGITQPKRCSAIGRRSNQTPQMTHGSLLECWGRTNSDLASNLGPDILRFYKLFTKSCKFSE